MNIVVDTSVIIAVILDEPEKARCIELTLGAELIAPQSLRWEIGNAFSAMFKRKRLSLKDALNAIQVYEGIPLKFADTNIGEALKLSEKYSIYAYDAYFMVCALKCHAPFLTLDHALTEVAKKAHIKVLEV